MPQLGRLILVTLTLEAAKDWTLEPEGLVVLVKPWMVGMVVVFPRGFVGLVVVWD